jgi:hypothetical protein
VVTLLQRLRAESSECFVSCTAAEAAEGLPGRNFHCREAKQNKLTYARLQGV